MSRVLPAIVMAALLGGCASVASSPPAESDSSSSASATPSPAQRSSPEPSVTAAPSATAAGANLTDQVVAVVTDDLVVRSRPGTGSASEIYPARLSAPSMVYVIDGPEDADGYAWYLVDPVAPRCYIGCDLATQPGWVAAADKDGERWLAEEPAKPECPAPALEDISAAAPQLWLYCFGARELTFNGVLGEPAPAPPGWPWGNPIGLHGPGWEGPVTGCVDACNIPLLTVAFDDGVEALAPLSAPQVTGHFDDARASECRPSDETDQRLVTHECRMVFVVTSWVFQLSSEVSEHIRGDAEEGK